MDPLDGVADATELLHVGLTAWVRHEAGQRAAEGERRSGDEQRAVRRARLLTLATEKARLHEIDATLELLEVSAVAPALVAELRALRRAVLRGRSPKPAPGASDPA